MMSFKLSPFFILSVILACFSVKAQTDDTPPGENTGNNSIPIIEKVYLHTDRAQYTLNEDLWYKAYLAYAYSNTLLDHSKVLYVELVSPDSKVVARNITRLDGGIGHGDFSLSDFDGFKAGTYQLRAYTNWMRNFGDDFIFTKPIVILDLNPDEQEQETDQQTNLVSTQETSKKSDEIDLQFFPEGGSLLTGVPSRVAFKAADRSGNPVEVDGNILDENGTIVTTFSSVHHGMGTFLLMDVKSQELTAEFSTKDDSVKHKKILPKAIGQGYLLSVTQRRSKYYISIKTNQETFSQNPDQPLTIRASTRGITYFEGAASLPSLTHTFLLPVKDFLAGITQITLYDGAMKPHSERLVYIHKGYKADVNLVSDKESYVPKEKVNLTITSKTTDGKAVPASFSLAVKESDQVGNSFLNSNICSWFLMESEIRGKIFDAGTYFDVSNAKRFGQLDLLLLTQGWRDFLWKKMPQPVTNQGFEVEKGILIRGQLNKRRRKSKDLYKINMALTKEGGVMMGEIDVLPSGDYQFGPIHFNGYALLLLNSKNQQKKDAGDIQLQPVFAQDTLKMDTVFPALKERNVFREKLIQKNRYFNVAAGYRLDDVVVTAKRETEKEEPKSRSIGNADFIRILDDRTPSFRSLLQLIPYAVPGTVPSGNSIRFSRFNGPALILIDGMQTFPEMLGDIPPDNVDRIEAITGPGGAVYGQQGANGVIMIFTKEGLGTRRSKKRTYRVSRLIRGFHNAREFYAPNYDDPTTIDPTRKDIRNTLFWEPYVHPDENGTAKLSYHNSEAGGTVDLVLEGVTETGEPIVIKKSYRIDPR